MKPIRTMFVLLVVLALLALSACAPAAPGAPAAGGESAAGGEAAAPPGEKVKLTVLTHWGEESLLKPMKAKLDEYMQLNPNVEIDYQAVTFDQLLTKITTARAAGVSPDIYHFYNLWMPDFVEGGMLAKPPAAVLDDIQASYSAGSQGAVSYGGEIWGYPTELNTYQMLYNKKMLQEAGIEQPPATLAELKDAACKLAKVGADGKMERSGFVLMPGWDSGVVHPFLSLLWSNNGEYLVPDTNAPLFASPEGQATLQLYVDMINEKCADPAIGAFGNFVEGKGAMLIMANWLRATLQSTFADGYENVGIAPIPTGEGGASTTVQYNWLYGVDSGGKNQEEAWKLVQWLNTPASEGAASPMGDYLTSALGAIPSRLSDQEALADRLSDDFMTAYLDSASSARAEPVLKGGQEIKTALQQAIEAAWYGQKPVDQALNDAAAEGERILAENQ